MVGSIVDQVVVNHSIEKGWYLQQLDVKGPFLYERYIHRSQYTSVSTR